jgi:glycerophosphoryl diester phosphodiesterase
MVELDVQLTRDREVVVIHDWTLLARPADVGRGRTHARVMICGCGACDAGRGSGQRVVGCVGSAGAVGAVVGRGTLWRRGVDWVSGRIGRRGERWVKTVGAELMEKVEMWGGSGQRGRGGA